MSELPRLNPLPLVQLPGPFDDPDFLYEVKFDGFRALAYVENGICELISRKSHTYTRFKNLCQSIATDLKADNAILDGEIVCLDDQGRSRFYDLMFHRGEPYFYAFDLLWMDGADLRDLPLVERKRKLRKLIPRTPSSVLYLDHINGKGVALFKLCCERDLEGVVAKPMRSPYRKVSGRTLWVKVKNPDYSQAEGRRELFERRRSSPS